MAAVTVSIPDSLKKKLDEFPEINWTEVVRKGFMRKLVLLKEFEAQHK